MGRLKPTVNILHEQLPKPVAVVIAFARAFILFGSHKYIPDNNSINFVCRRESSKDPPTPRENLHCVLLILHIYYSCRLPRT